MLLILKCKRATRTGALKCLDFATTCCPPACDRVVDQQGLKTLFAIFMGKLKVNCSIDWVLQLRYDDDMWLAGRS
jgi:beta-catenin-like protein 1